MARKYKVNPAVKVAGQAAFDGRGRPKPGVARMMGRAVEVQRPLVLANLRRLRNKYPHAGVAELGTRLEHHFLVTVSGTGALVGSTAIVPGIGTVASLSLSAAATIGFLEASALYAQSIAELHGIQLHDPDRARTMVMAIMLGEEGSTLVRSFAGQAAGKGGDAATGWAALLGNSMPMTVVRSIGDRIRKRFMRRLIAGQGSAMLGRAVPFGVGAVIGGSANLMLGRAVIRSARNAFGPAPLELPDELALQLQGPQMRRAGRKS